MQLEDCPFCAKSLDIEDSDTLHPSGSRWIQEPDGFRHYISYDDPRESDGRVWVVNCVLHYSGCGASISGDSKAEAVKRWNTRND